MNALLDTARIGPRSAPPWVRLGVAVAGLAVALVFLRAAWPKIANPGAFALMIYRYQVLPDTAINPTALILPWLEALCALALLAAPRWRTAASALIVGMLLVFTALLILTILRGIDISCGCFSVEPEGTAIGWQNVARNILLLALTGLVLWAHRGTEGDR